MAYLEKLSAKKSLKSRKKRRKNLKVHKAVILKPDDLPKGSRLLRYRDYSVQNIRIEAENIKYKRAVYKTPEGKLIYAKLPLAIKGSHYGPDLRAYILSLYYASHVSQKDIVSALRDYDIEISAAQVSRILTQGRNEFHKEKQGIALWSKALIRAPLTSPPLDKAAFGTFVYSGARGHAALRLAYKAPAI